MRVIYAGGATGGHLMPGVATARAVERTLPGSRALFLVSGSPTERHCRGALAEFQTAWMPRTPWHGKADKVLFAGKSLWAAQRMVEIVRGFRPHLVMGLGSYNSAVPVLVGRLLGVKTALMAADVLPGLAVRLLAPMVDRVMVQYAEALPALKARSTAVTGLPVRRRILQADRRAAMRRLGLRPGRPTLLAAGGSQGALALNETLYRALEMAFARHSDLQVIHLTGIDHLQSALDRRLSLRGSYRPIGFLERMEDAYAAADFFFGRAGASTLAELTALGLPSILVPYPYAANDHQRLNAEVLSAAGAAITMDQSELTPERLAEALMALAGDARMRRRMSERAASKGRPDAADNVAHELADLAGFGQKTKRTSIPKQQTRGRQPRAA